MKNDKMTETIRIEIPVPEDARRGTGQGRSVKPSIPPPRPTSKVTPEGNAARLPSAIAQIILAKGTYDAFVLTTTTGIVSEFNERATALLGYDPPEFCGANIVNMISGAGETILAEIKENGRDGRFTLINANFIRKDRWIVPVEISATVVHTGQAEAICFSIRDISSRKEIEEKLLQANRTKSLHMLAESLAHDFNNKLTSIIGNTEMAMASISSKTKAHEDLTVALSDARKLGELSHRMLSYSGKGVFAKARIDLNNVLGTAVSKIARIIPANVTFNAELWDSQVIVGGERELLETMTRNILINAIEAIGKEHKSVSASVSIATIDNAFIESHRIEYAIKPGVYACLTVTDNGYGMDEALIDNIFEPFFSTKGAGRGLGLTEVQGIVLAHGGAIAIESRIGEGSTFNVILPLFTPPVRDLRTGTGDAAGEPAQRRTILVADDEPSICRYTTRVLERQGFQVLTADDGQQAIDIFRAHADEIGLAIIDMFMPRVNGDEVLKTLRKLRPQVKVILTSGYTEATISEKLTTEQPTTFLYKPFATSDFLKLVNGILDAR